MEIPGQTFHLLRRLKANAKGVCNQTGNIDAPLIKIGG
jgi:hypothetical protein